MLQQIQSETIKQKIIFITLVLHQTHLPTNTSTILPYVTGTKILREGIKRYFNFILNYRIL
jgi:hypothetical protein